MNEKFSQQQILKMFYICGSVIFLIVGIANTFTNFTNWERMLLSMKVSSLFMNIFNYVLAVFFFMLFKKIKISIPPPALEEKEIDSIFEEAKKSQMKK